jgi:hypothetical protein
MYAAHIQKPAEVTFFKDSNSKCTKRNLVRTSHYEKRNSDGSFEKNNSQLARNG